MNNLICLTLPDAGGAIYIGVEYIAAIHRYHPAMGRDYSVVLLSSGKAHAVAESLEEILQRIDDLNGELPKGE